MATDLWQAFLDVHAKYEAWDSEFMANPHSPSGPLEAFVKAGGADRVATLLTALQGDNRSLRYWACVGLGWLGPEGGAQVAAALERAMNEEFLQDTAAVALEHVDSPRLRASGAYRNKKVREAVTRDHLERKDPAPLVEFLEWIAAHEAPEVLTSVVRDWFFRDALVRYRRAAVVSCLRRLLRSRDAEVRAAVSDLLTTAGEGEAAADALLDLAGRKDVSLYAIQKLASHPLSEVLVPALVEKGNIYLLSMLLERRRCAGLSTNPGPLRALIAERLERPKRDPRFEQHDVHTAALCAAEAQDPQLIESLVVAVNPLNGGYAWAPLVRASRSYGAPMVKRLKEEQALESDPARKEQLDSMLAALAKPLEPLATRLQHADAQFLSGRIETSLYDAFRLYSTVLLEEPSAHAAFQLAWIDRAFGSEIVPSRVEWIRSLGFRDEALLAELATPLKEPLNGSRTAWDPGQSQQDDRARAEKALAAGLPSMAAGWFKDERYTADARTFMERVRSAT